MTAAELKPYPEYKDSGVEWLGEIPVGWEVRPGRDAFREVVQRNRPSEEMLSVTIGAGVQRQVQRLEASSAKDSSNLDKTSYKLVEPGDLAYNKMRAWQGALGVSPFRGIVSPAYIIMRSRGDLLPEYVHSLLRIPAFATEAERWSYGITSDQWSFRSKDFKQVYFPIPPPRVQQEIVRYLHQMNEMIQQLIAAKERLIELLEEESQAIINHAVTRGLDSDVQMKDSGVDWLGKVPAHWDVLNLGRVVDILAGFPFSSEDFSTDDQDIRLLRGVNVSPGETRWADVVYWRRADKASYEAFELEAGDLVLGLDRPIIQSGIRVATIGPSDLPSLLLQRVARIRTKPGANSEYVRTLLAGRQFSTYIEPIFSGISVPHLSPEQVRKFSVALPPLEEQRLIVTSISTDSARLHQAAANARRHIDLLREYRTRLISDVVTGKLDVRSAQVTMPEERATETASRVASAAALDQ